MNKVTRLEESVNPRALKHRFGRDLLQRIADSISAAYPAFDKPAFMDILADLAPLEMKPRVQTIRDGLRRQLPTRYPDALRILLISVRDNKLEGFDFWPYTEFIQTYGLDDLVISLEALKELTKVFTSEWAVRPFIKHFPEKTMRFLERCAVDGDTNVRRWASEGSRPRLPWGERLGEFVRDPRPTLPILELLKFDPELFVRKSVANHLNDIAKDHPELVVEILSRWKNGATGEDLRKVEWIVKQALRTLIKNGHPEALGLIGVTKAMITLDDLMIVNDIIKVGGQLDFGFVIHSISSCEQKLVIDYLIHFVRSNQTTTPKVFKLKVVQLSAGGALRVEKSHPLKKITTREYYPGLHRLEIQVNGVVVGTRTWTLVA